VHGVLPRHARVQRAPLLCHGRRRSDPPRLSSVAQMMGELVHGVLPRPIVLAVWPCPVQLPGRGRWNAAVLVHGLLPTLLRFVAWPRRRCG